MWPTVTDRVAWSVTVLSPARTAEPIEMPFNVDLGGPKETCIR